MGGGFFVMDRDSAWSRYIGCATAQKYASGILTALSGIHVMNSPIDRVALNGVEIYLGYGKRSAEPRDGDSCQDMLQMGTYNMAYTIQ